MLEQIYSDFTTQVLPKISNGLMISQSYFNDLFGRYIHYLIITDAIKLGICVFGFITYIVAVCLIIKWLRNKKEEPNDDVIAGVVALFVILFFLLIISGISIVACSFNLIQDIYIPEVRIIEVISNLK